MTGRGVNRLTVRLGLALMLVLAVTSCVRRPDGVASDKKMASVLVDLELADAWLQSSSYMSEPTKREALLNFIIKKHGLTREEYDSTMSWYARNEDAYYELCQLAEKEMSRKRRSMMGQSASVDDNSVDLWPYSRMLMFTSWSTSDGLVFSLPATGLEKGDRLRFKMRFNDLVSGMARLSVEYDDGNRQYIAHRMSGSRNIEMNFITDTSKVVSRIMGDVRIDGLRKHAVWADSISLIPLPFDSTTYYNIHVQKNYSKPARRQPLINAGKDSVGTPGVPHNSSRTTGNAVDVPKYSITRTPH